MSTFDPNAVTQLPPPPPSMSDVDTIPSPAPDPPSAPEHMPRAPGCCGQVPERTQIIEQVSSQVSFAHDALAKLYRSLAEDYKDQPEEYVALHAAMLKQEQMSEWSKIVTLPAGVEATMEEKL